MNIKQASLKIDKLFAEAYEIACKAVEAEARRIMRRHPRCASFCMGMGSARFYDKEGNPVGEWGPLNYPAYLSEFDNMVNAWDDMLKISGHPMKIVGADGERQNDW